MNTLYLIVAVICIVVYIKLQTFRHGSELFQTPQVILHAVNTQKKLELAKLYNTLECDARITKDNIPILFHDGLVNNVPVNELTLEQLRQVTGTQVLTLEQLLKSPDISNKKVIIDIKTYNYELIQQIGYIVSQENKWNNVILGSFHPFIIMSVKRNFPMAKTCYMWCKNCIDYLQIENDEIRLPKIIDFRFTRQLLDLIYYWLSPYIAVLLKVDVVGIEDIDINPEIISYFKNKGISVYSWKWNLRKSEIDPNVLMTQYNVSICV